MQVDQEIACHYLVAQMTNQMAEAYFEQWLTDISKPKSPLYRHYKQLREDHKLDHIRYIFIDAVGPTLIDSARKYLTQALKNPLIPQDQRDSTAQALILDSSIPGAQDRAVKAYNRCKFIMKNHPIFTGTKYV